MSLCLRDHIIQMIALLILRLGSALVKLNPSCNLVTCGLPVGHDLETLSGSLLLHCVRNVKYWLFQEQIQLWLDKQNWFHHNQTVINLYKSNQIQRLYLMMMIFLWLCTLQIIVEGIRGTGALGDIAVDDLSFTNNTSCSSKYTL